MMFTIFTILGFAFAGVVEWLFALELTPILTVAIALSTGFVGLFLMLVLDLYDWPSVRSEIAQGECLEIEVMTTHAISVRFPNSNQQGLALDCGENTVVLIGNWWISKLRPELWLNPEMCTMFPSSHFKLCYLPISHYVLFVEPFGKPLRIKDEENDIPEPTMNIDFPKNAEVTHVNQPLNLLIK